MMQFRTRSKDSALADLWGKLRQLPPTHPDLPALTRMIRALGDEIVAGQGLKPRADPIGP
jgi:hypothetical protein